GQWLVAQEAKQGIRLWDLKTKKPSEIIVQLGVNRNNDEKPSVSDTAISPDSQWLIVGMDDGKVLLWRLSRPAPVTVELPDDREETGADVRARITAVAFSEDS